MKTKFYIFIAVLCCQVFCFASYVSACPLCQAGATKKTQAAYLDTTFLLMSIPIVGGGIFFFWLRAKYGRGETK